MYVLCSFLYFPLIKFSPVIQGGAAGKREIFVSNKSEISVSFINYYLVSHLPFWAHLKQQTNKLSMHVWPRYCACLVFAETLDIIFPPLRVYLELLLCRNQRPGRTKADYFYREYRPDSYTSSGH